MKTFQRLLIGVVILVLTSPAVSAQQKTEPKPETATDPAVQAGRLAMDIHPWMVPEGVLP